MKEKRIIFAILALLSSISISSSLAYWNPTVKNDVKSLSLSINLGSWAFEDEQNQSSVVDFFEDIKIDKSGYTHFTTIKGKPASSYDVIVVYYSKTNLYYKLDLSKRRDACNPYNGSTQSHPCILPDYSNKYDNPYEPLTVDYLDHLLYRVDSTVRYKNKYYRNKDGNQMVPGGPQYNAWEAITETYSPNTTYKINDKVVVDHELFIATANGKLSDPRLFLGEWNHKSYNYEASNTYKYHDVVFYNGNYYYALFDNLKGIHPDNSSYWSMTGV